MYWSTYKKHAWSSNADIIIIIIIWYVCQVSGHVVPVDRSSAVSGGGKSSVNRHLTHVHVTEFASWAQRLWTLTNKEDEEGEGGECGGGAKSGLSRCGRGAEIKDGYVARECGRLWKTRDACGQCVSQSSCTERRRWGRSGGGGSRPAPCFKSWTIASSSGFSVHQGGDTTPALNETNQHRKHEPSISCKCVL